jgi:hypothetical protein
VPKIANWSTPLTQVEGRLRKLDQVLHAAQGVDGSVDLVKARKLAGTDQAVSRMVTGMRADRFGTSLKAEQAQRQFQELQQALSTVKDHDHNHDRKLGFDEVPYAYSDSKAHRLLLEAAMPASVINGDTAAPRAWGSVDARVEAEKAITERATFHAATPLGAEAIKWEMRLSLVEGRDVNDPIINDPINFTEKSWQRHLPVIGARHRGQGHLSDKELVARYGNLNDYCRTASARVNAQLMMDYASEFLAGKDLPQ